MHVERYVKPLGLMGVYGRLPSYIFRSTSYLVFNPATHRMIDSLNNMIETPSRLFLPPQEEDPSHGSPWSNIIDDETFHAILVKTCSDWNPYLVPSPTTSSREGSLQTCRWPNARSG